MPGYAAAIVLHVYADKFFIYNLVRKAELVSV